jgi:hypothetical protein
MRRGLGVVLSSVFIYLQLKYFQTTPPVPSLSKEGKMDSSCLSVSLSLVRRGRLFSKKSRGVVAFYF